MPRSATTGVYARVSNSFSQPVFGTLIDPTDADAYFDDLDVGLNPANLAGPTNIIGALTLGKAGSAVGTLGFFNATSGSITLSPPAGALGSAVLTLPDQTGSLAVADFIQPVSYPPVITSGHVIPFLDSDAQFGNAWSQYPLGSVSPNPLIVGKAGCSIGSTTPGQTFKIVFTSTGLTGSPITITYTAGGAETTTTIAAGLAALVNANSVLHGLGGKPIFMQSLGAGLFNLQYDSAFSATGATPLTTATTGSTGTITLVGENNILDFVVMQLGRNVPARAARAGDALYALDFTGQDSTGTFNTNYGQICLTATTVTAGGTRGSFSFNTANNAGGPTARLGIGTGVYIYDAAGAAPTGGDLGGGAINVATTYGLAGAVIANSAGLFTPSNNIFGGVLAGSGLNLQSTQSGVPSGDFVQITAGGKIGYKFDGVTSTFGTSTSLLGKIAFANLTSGTIAIQAPTGALGSAVLTLPIATDTLIGKATTDILTNKTFDTAGAGNVFKINGTTISAITGTGSAVLSASANMTGTITMSGSLLVGAASTSIGATFISHAGVDQNFVATGPINLADGVSFLSVNDANNATKSLQFNASQTYFNSSFSIGTTTNPGATNVLVAGSILSNSGTLGIGYATGAGGAVTQLTSRTTTVILNKVSGAITLFTAAGSATAASFTVTNSTVAATDTINLSVKSSTTNKYNAFVTAVAAGSFEITFNTTGGTTSDTPVFNFNVIKGVAS